MKFLSRIVSLVLTIFLFIGASSITANAASSRQEVLGVAFVTASALRLRSGAGTDTATLDYASQNEVVVLLERIGDWYKVNYNLQEGWMHEDYLDVLQRENAELGYGKITGNGVNVLAMGAFYVAPAMGCDIADAYLNAELGSGYEWWYNFYEFHKLAMDELDAFDYEAYKANGFKMEHLGDYPLKLETKPEN